MNIISQRPLTQPYAGPRITRDLLCAGKVRCRNRQGLLADKYGCVVCRHGPVDVDGALN